jgi:hypothetical protein
VQSTCIRCKVVPGHSLLAPIKFGQGVQVAPLIELHDQSLFKIDVDVGVDEDSKSDFAVDAEGNEDVLGVEEMIEGRRRKVVMNI